MRESPASPVTPLLGENYPDVDWETIFRKRGDPAFQAVVVELLEQIVAELRGGRRA